MILVSSPLSLSPSCGHTLTHTITHTLPLLRSLSLSAGSPFVPFSSPVPFFLLIVSASYSLFLALSCCRIIQWLFVRDVCYLVQSCPVRGKWNHNFCCELYCHWTVYYPGVPVCRVPVQRSPLAVHPARCLHYFWLAECISGSLPLSSWKFMQIFLDPVVWRFLFWLWLMPVICVLITQWRLFTLSIKDC